MSSSTSISSIYVLTFLMVVQIAICVDPLFHSCSSTSQKSTSKTYDHNLNKLLGDLYFKTPPTGFGRSSVGQHQDRAHGLSLCRGDLSPNDCKTCVVDASTEIRKLCPNDKGATIWYGNCLLKYSGVDFFGQINNQVKYYIWNKNNVTDPKLFNANVKGLLGSLSAKASVEPRMYASGERGLGHSQQKIYGMVQCTRDLTSEDCKKCLDDAIRELPSCCDGKQGGRVIGASCNIRYETSPFLTA